MDLWFVESENSLVEADLFNFFGTSAVDSPGTGGGCPGIDGAEVFGGVLVGKEGAPLACVEGDSVE